MAPPSLSSSLSQFDFTRGDGFVTVIAQDHRTGAVLMVARADREAIERTLSTGEMHYHSRTRGLWHKGATSGNVQKVISLTPDCDGDAILARVIPAGPACHNGTVSCFAEPGRAGDVLGVLQQTIADRLGALGRGELGTSYTQKLLGDRNLRLKKLGEEASELAVACADEDTSRAAEEGADLVYHAMVALAALGVTWDDVRSVMHARHS